MYMRVIHYAWNPGRLSVCIMRDVECLNYDLLPVMSINEFFRSFV